MNWQKGSEPTANLAGWKRVTEGRGQSWWTHTGRTADADDVDRGS